MLLLYILYVYLYEILYCIIRDATSAASSPKTYITAACRRRAAFHYIIHRARGGAYNIYALNARGMMVPDEGCPSHYYYYYHYTHWRPVPIFNKRYATAPAYTAITMCTHSIRVYDMYIRSSGCSIPSTPDKSRERRYQV